MVAACRAAVAGAWGRISVTGARRPWPHAGQRKGSWPSRRAAVSCHVSCAASLFQNKSKTSPWHLSPRLSYLLSQGLKEDLVERVEDWPGIHFGKYLLEGRSLMAGKWADRTRKYRLEMQRRSKKKKEDREVSPDEYTTTLTIELLRFGGC
jgi:hypothetical protein